MTEILGKKAVEYEAMQVEVMHMEAVRMRVIGVDLILKGKEGLFPDQRTSSI